MIAVDPSVRPSFDTLLHTSRGSVFPESFYSFFHNYVSSINELSSNSPFASNAGPAGPPAPAAATVKSPQVVTSQPLPGSSGDVSNEPLPSDSDRRMERIWSDFESVEPFLSIDTAVEPVMDVKVDYMPSMGSYKPFQVCTKRSTHSLVTDDTRRIYCQSSYISPIERARLGVLSQQVVARQQRKVGERLV